MRILLAGDWHSEIHEEAAANALETLGNEVRRFAWNPYFLAGETANLRGRTFRGLFRRGQNKYLFGPRFNRLNSDLVAVARDFGPDVVFVYRGTHVMGHSLLAIREQSPGVILVGLSNDDPFSPRQPRWLWRHLMEALSEYDLMLAYRWQNVAEFERAGARNVRLLRSWYVPERNHPLDLSEDDRQRWGADVVFAGHYEPDKRIEYLDALVAAGVALKIYGPDYPPGLRAPCLVGSLPVRALPGEEYNKALCGAKIALCFFSTLNRDTYTRRCFEIPSTGTLMLCEYSADAATLFAEGQEAEFFRSKEELVAKAKALLADPGRRASIAAAGRRRVLADGHDVASRMRQVLGCAEEIRAARPYTGKRPC